MTQDKRTKFNAQISEEAAEWFVDFRLGNIDSTGRREFDAWIRSSPEHLRAYLETAAIWNEGSSLSAHRDLDSDALIALARTEGNVVPLDLDRPRASSNIEEKKGSPYQVPDGRGTPQFLEGSVSLNDKDELEGDRLPPITGANGKSSKTPEPPSLTPSGSAELTSSALSALGERERRPAPREGEVLSGPRMGRLRPFAVAASILLVTASLVTYLLAPRGVYATAVGERRILTLEDGSSVELNSRSRIRVRFAEHQRDVELLEGQVLFHVAKDPHRPFIVRSDTVRVRAVGTQFDVNRKTTGTTVTVVEGRVAVYRDGNSGPGTAITPPEINTKESGQLPEPVSRRGATSINLGKLGTPVPGTGSAEPPTEPAPQAPSAAIFLTAGDQVTVSDLVPPSQPQRASPAAATAWTQGQLVLDDASLAEVAEAFSRYSARRLTVEDHGARPLQLSGVFATDPDFLLHYLRQRPDITVQETSTEVRIIRHD